QPGEVIYLAQRNMLFYVNSVQHQFTFASGFTTTLNLTYGHSPGEYIPTVMDAIGKLIYANKDSGSLSVQRQESSSNDINIGALISDSNSDNPQPVNTGDPNSATTTLSAFNTQVISNILYTAAYLINANNTQGNNVVAKVELRAYYDNSTGSVDEDLDDFRQTIYNALTAGANATGPVSAQAKSPGGNPSNPPLPTQYVDMTSASDVNLDSATDG